MVASSSGKYMVAVVAALLGVPLSNGSRMRSWHYKSPYQFRPVPVPWFRAVAVHVFIDVLDLPQHVRRGRSSSTKRSHRGP